MDREAKKGAREMVIEIDDLAVRTRLFLAFGDIERANKLAKCLLRSAKLLVKEIGRLNERKEKLS